MKWKEQIRRRIRKARKLWLYVLQKTTSWRFDPALEANLAASTPRILSGQCPATVRRKICSISEFAFDDQARFKIYCPDRAKTFVAAPDGPETDNFGRRGKWKSRGVQIYEEVAEDRLIKTFPPRFSALGEGRFIEEALAAGFYDHLCPLLEFLIHDNRSQLVGYCIKRGRQLTRFEFERYVDGILCPLICEATTRSGFYFYDLVEHNVIVRDGVIPSPYIKRTEHFSA